MYIYSGERGVSRVGWEDKSKVRERGTREEGGGVGRLAFLAGREGTKLLLFFFLILQYVEGV